MTRIRLMYCNACNSVNGMILVHVLVLTMQVPMYSARVGNNHAGTHV